MSKGQVHLARVYTVWESPASKMSKGEVHLARLIHRTEKPRLKSSKESDITFVRTTINLT
jgi:hypothetical protein